MLPLILKLDRRIEQVNLQHNAAADFDSAKNSGQFNNAAQIAQAEQLCENLKNIIETLSHFQDTSFAKYSQDIARLSVEIARKVLEQKVKDEDYEIETIIRQALEGLTVKQDIVVKLNPKDHIRIEELLKNSEIRDFQGLAFVPDDTIQPAECILQTPQGTIESLIEEKLKHITEALTKTE